MVEHTVSIKIQIEDDEAARMIKATEAEAGKLRRTLNGAEDETRPGTLATRRKRLPTKTEAAVKGGVPPEGDPERKVAADALRTMVENNYALTGDRTSFNYNQLVEAAAGQSFAEFKQTLESDIAIALLGQANTAELPERGGSRAAVQVLNLIREDIHLADIRRTERVANEQLLLYDYQLNVDPGAERAPYRFRIEIEEEADAERTARAISETLEAGIPLLADDVYARLGFERPPGVPDVIRSPRDINPPGGT